MTDERVMPQYDGMEYEELVSAAQFLWMENVKLLQERDLYRELFHLTTEPDIYVQVRDENEKLRKLARGLNWCTEGPDGPRVDCEHCPLGEVEGKPLELMCEVMMRELGIEVE